MSGSAQKISFEQLVESGHGWISWINGASQLESILKSKINWEALRPDESTFIRTRLKITAPPKQVLINSVYVTMTAGFEEYLRSSLKGIANQLTKEKKRYSEINRQLVRTNIREAAKLLNRMDSPPDYLQFSEDDLCLVIGSCISSSSTVMFSAEALSEVGSLIKLSSFLERLTALGKPSNIDNLGRDNRIKAALGQRSTASPREVGRLLELELAKIAKFRNRIAHTGGSASDVTDQILEMHRDLLYAVVASIDTHISQ